MTIVGDVDSATSSIGVMLLKQNRIKPILRARRLRLFQATYVRSQEGSATGIVRLYLSVFL